MTEDIKLRKKQVFWVEDKDDPSVAFEESRSADLKTTQKELEAIQKALPNKTFFINSNYVCKVCGRFCDAEFNENYCLRCENEMYDAVLESQEVTE